MADHLVISAPWLEQYYTDGLTSLRLYARGWKFGEDPTYEGLWKACLQQMDRGVVLAERVTEYAWIPKEETSKWAEDQLPPSFRICTKQDACLGPKGVFKSKKYSRG